MTTLSWHQLDEGLREARRIIRDAIGYDFARETVPFAPEYKKLALAAIDEVEHAANLWRCHREFNRMAERQREDSRWVDREVHVNDGRG